MPPGLLDANVFTHDLTHKALAEERLRSPKPMASGKPETRLETIILRELSYALPHCGKGMNRSQVDQYLLAVLA